jgi:hypothetical protein
MLKPLLLSGWFRTHPLLNYVVAVILITPLFAASGHSSVAKSRVVKVTSMTGESDSVSKEVAAFKEPDIAEIVKAQTSSLREFDSVPIKKAAVEKPQILAADKIKSLLEEKNYLADDSLSSSNVSTADPFAAVELAPSPGVFVSQLHLVQKLKAAKIKSLREKENSQARQKPVSQSLAAVELAPIARESQPTTTTETPAEETQAEQIDPIGSPHPIPWKWITATQETIGSKGSSGVRYYRSLPVVSPDGKYAVYSRVQLEVKPEMYNSRVTSVLFVQDMQTNKLWVMASTAPVSDPLLAVNAVLPEQEQIDTNGSIGVLVPVSWSEKGDRFLARKFKGIFNTGDATDHAVIWDRQKNQANIVAPAQEENEHEKIAILLGWSKSQPDHVLFRAGEMGEENWPLVKVANDGKTVPTTTDADQPITFGKKVTEVWAGPQVAYR